MKKCENDSDEESQVHEELDTTEEQQAEELSAEELDEEEELPTGELPDVEPLVVNRPLARSLDAEIGGRSYQRSIPIRYGISDNSTRASRLHPDAKHLTIKLPDAVSRFFACVWVAVQGDEVFIDFYARNDQNDRTGHADRDPWRWIKIKDSGEIAMAINRSYTKSRCDGELVRDYKVGAFKLVVPIKITGMNEPGSEAQPNRLFG